VNKRLFVKFACLLLKKKFTFQKVGIITLLDAAFRVPAIQGILQTDYFWQKKLAYDFPELIEFVGASLPEWATAESSSFLGQSDASDYLPFGPWRRYYYTARYFMRLVYKVFFAA
jgi:hypothetical protein